MIPRQYAEQLRQKHCKDLKRHRLIWAIGHRCECVSTQSLIAELLQDMRMRTRNEEVMNTVRANI